ncbi:head GIN domain-containing protein [Oceanirhabdus seepicola]|uniref:DUF2807 domain-containing protein n=1 Tax=Oceanirhabdus seepicola TaxID=2828781 RepID=A0A9J6P0B6_9CLOT|nr:head GIN domain-containing protein [Oceanirhabdus seepicola]MCM1989979.1 DUF2807 domain-containing protein [Oceanirhabdus seepicola]
MKKIISIITTLALTLTCCASVSATTAEKTGRLNLKTLFNRSTIKGSDNSETKTFELTDFNKISASHVFQVTIEKSNEFDVEVTYDDNLSEYLEVELKDDTLRLSLDNKHNYDDVTLKATVKVPDICEINGSGVTSFELKEGFEFEHDLYVDLSGVSKLTGKIKMGDVDIDISGCSKVKLEGSGKDLSCHASGVSGVDFEEFQVDNADIQISGSSNAIINADGKIKVAASGISKLEYKGDGTIESSGVSGLSEVKKIK